MLLIFADKTATSGNTILQTYTMLVSNSASGLLPLTTATAPRVGFTCSKIQPQYGEGLFRGNKKLTLRWTRHGLGWIKFQSQNFMLSEVMGFKLYNEFGAEFGASIFNLNAVNSADGKTVTLTRAHWATLNINRATRQQADPVLGKRHFAEQQQQQCCTVYLCLPSGSPIKVVFSESIG